MPLTQIQSLLSPLAASAQGLIVLPQAHLALPIHDQGAKAGRHQFILDPKPQESLFTLPDNCLSQCLQVLPFELHDSPAPKPLHRLPIPRQAPQNPNLLLPQNKFDGLGEAGGVDWSDAEPGGLFVLI